jgi:hypothetical protein
MPQQQRQSLHHNQNGDVACQVIIPGGARMIGFHQRASGAYTANEIWLQICIRACACPESCTEGCQFKDVPDDCAVHHHRTKQELKLVEF